MQLNSVVLPAPFGPISPTISPRSMASVTPRLAMSPPKRFVAASTVSSGAIDLPVDRGRLDRRATRLAPEPAPPRQRQQARRAEGRDGHDDHAVHDQIDAAPRERPGPEGRAHDLRDRDENDRAEHRSPQMTDAADDGGHDRQRRPVELEHLLRKHGQRPERVEDAGGGEYP